MIAVSERFKNAIYSGSNSVVYKVLLYLGNYASAGGAGASATSSGDVSSDYPASGAIDGDRTELNIGPAAGADNDIGKSSWRSSGIPDANDVVTLDITFSKSRTINRIKLYHLANHGLKTFNLQYWDGSSWQVFAATTDIVDDGQLSITSTHELDVIDFSDIVTTKIRLQVFATVVANDNANVVEFEVYRAIDISNRVRAVNTSRGRDYKMQDPLAAQVTISAINTDGFFSKDYIPTTAEIASGFVNDELRPNIGVEVQAGFETFFGDPELVTIFTGSIDNIKPSAAGRKADITGTDGMKGLLRTKDCCKLKTNIDIADAIRYVLNRANISNYEIETDTTSIFLDYFFTEDEDHLSTIRDLVEAASDSLFRFDLTGKATFKMFSNAVGHDRVFTSEADWETGLLNYIDTTSTPGKIMLKYGDHQTWNGSTAGWSFDGQGSFTFATDADGIVITGTTDPYHIESTEYRATPQHFIGEWNMDVRGRQTSTNAAGGRGVTIPIQIGLMIGSIVHPYSGPGYTERRFANSYALQIDASATGGVSTIILYRTDSNGVWCRGIVSASANFSSGFVNVKVRRAFDGTNYLWTLIINGVATATVSDNTFTSGQYFGYLMYYSPFTASNTVTTWNIKNVGFATPGANDGVGVWTSPVIDMTTGVAALGLLNRTHVLNNGTVTYETRTSSNGSVWSDWVEIGPTGAILSDPLQFMQIRITPRLKMVYSPEISDITANWTQVAGSAKYPPAPSSFQFRGDGILRDLELTFTDKMAGQTAILNDLSVQAQPMILDGNNTDDKWQALNGTPQEPVSVTNALNVTNGQTLTFPLVISGGMDTSLMAGANPAAAVVTFAGGAAGSWHFSSIHPTRPILVVNISASGTITDLRVVGRQFSNASYLQVSRVEDQTSINENGRCQESIQNKWIGSANQALVIAQKLVANYKDPISFASAVKLDPIFNAEEGDRATVVESSLGVSADFVIANLEHRIEVPESGGDASIETSGALLRVPVGL